MVFLPEKRLTGKFITYSNKSAQTHIVHAAETGDLFTVRSSGIIYSSAKSAWKSLGSIASLSAKYTAVVEVQNLVSINGIQVL